MSEPPSSMFRGRTEELLRGVESTGVDTTGHDPAGRRLRQVVRTGEPGDAVEDDDDVTACLDEPLGPLDRELGDRSVLVGRPVEVRGDDLTFDRAPHVGYLLGPLGHEKDHEVDFGIVRFDRVRDLLHHRRLAGLRRRHDQATLALSDRREQIDDPGGHVVAGPGRLETELRVREQRSQFLELRTVPRVVGAQARDRVDPDQRRELLVAGRRPAGAFHVVALSQREAPRLADRHVDIAGARQIAVGAEEPVALVAQVEQAVHRDQVSLVLRF